MAVTSSRKPTEEDLRYEFGVRSDVGLMECSDKHHARAMMETASLVLGTKSSRVMVRRPRAEWESVPEGER